MNHQLPPTLIVILITYYPGNVEAFPCHVSAAYDATLDLKLCENLADPQEDKLGLAWIFDQFVSCPESWIHDQWTLEPDTNMPYNQAFMKK